MGLPILFFLISVQSVIIPRLLDEIFFDMTEQTPLLKLALHVLDEMQAIDVKVLDVRTLTSITDYMIVSSGRSTRHVKSIASKLIEEMKKHDLPPLSSSGLEEGDWALVDLNDCIVHVMLSETRAFYNLEGLWQNEGRE